MSDVRAQLVGSEQALLELIKLPQFQMRDDLRVLKVVQRRGRHVVLSLELWKFQGLDAGNDGRTASSLVLYHLDAAWAASELGLPACSRFCMRLQ